MSFVWYLLPLAVYLFYKWSTSTFDFFTKQGVPFLKPLPLVGSSFELFFKKKPFVESLTENYKKFKSNQLFGTFSFRQPSAFILDPKLVKQITVRDFDHFMDHRSSIKVEDDPLFGSMLTALTGQKWKDMRSTLSPAFTGSKMRLMFDFVNDVGKQTTDTMLNDIKSGKESSFEFKLLSLRFTVDVIASCAFGIEVNSFKNPENSFFKFATNVQNFGGFRNILKFVLIQAAPKLVKLLGIEIMDKEMTEFFKAAVLDTMKAREQQKIVRPDMINLLIQAKKGQLAHNNNEEKKEVEGFATVEESHVGKSDVGRTWTDIELAAQCLVFFFAGFETIATTMSFMAYELVCNPDIQEKLYAEIAAMEKELGGKKISYEQLQGMKYLDQTVCETLRKWPLTAAIIERNCVKDYDLKYGNGKTLKFDKSLNLFVPVWCFHHDPEYFPNPEKFDPERFSAENRGNIDPDTYLPFGAGPRNCIGSRFALMELKTIFYNLMQKFKLEATERTTIPFEYENVPFAMKPKDGIWIALKPRN